MSSANKIDWNQERNKAACRNMDTDLFFGVTNEDPAAKRAREERAKEICRRCMVLEACRSHALDIGVETGVWAGTTEEERAAGF